jgi:hypothetical protein
MEEEEDLSVEDFPFMQFLAFGVSPSSLRDV